MCEFFLLEIDYCFDIVNSYIIGVVIRIIGFYKYLLYYVLFYDFCFYINFIRELLLFFLRRRKLRRREVVKRG